MSSHICSVFRRHECQLDMYAGRQGAMGSAQLDHGVCDNLRQARRKTATGSLAHVMSPTCELGKVCTNDKGVCP
jgi:hypothetical protein